MPFGDSHSGLWQPHLAHAVDSPVGRAGFIHVMSLFLINWPKLPSPWTSSSQVQLHKLLPPPFSPPSSIPSPFSPWWFLYSNPIPFPPSFSSSSRTARKSLMPPFLPSPLHALSYRNTLANWMTPREVHFFFELDPVHQTSWRSLFSSIQYM